jgi:response regulator NasT
MEQPMRVMLIDENLERRVELRAALCESGCEVVEQSDSMLDIIRRVADLQPDMIIIDTDSPSRDTLEHICVVSRDQPRPIVMFTQDGSTDKIRAALSSGVSSYVVDGLDPARIKPILDVALTRFEEHQALRRELDQANAALAERKVVERAKGILMRQRNLGEEEAYQAMRKMAMERSMKMAELAQQIIAASALLS